MQIVKHKTEPIKDITKSNEGTRIAMTRMTAVRTIRTAIRNNPRLDPDSPARPGGEATLRASRPRTLSAELMIGRVLEENRQRRLLTIREADLLERDFGDRYDGNEHNNAY